MASANPPGSKTGARHQGKAGNSGDPMDSSKEGGRVAQPAHRKETRRSMGSRMSPYERRRGVTPAEQREAHAVDRSMATPSTLRGGATATTGVERIASRARREPQTRYTALMHHFSVDIAFGEGRHEEACAVIPQEGLCEEEAHNGAWWKSVTLPKPKGGSKQGTQNTPKHWRSPLYSTSQAYYAVVMILSCCRALCSLWIMHHHRLRIWVYPR